MFRNLYINTKISSDNSIIHYSNLALTPLRYLWNGKKVKIVPEYGKTIETADLSRPEDWKIKEKFCHYRDRTVMKNVLALAALVPGLIIGSSLRMIGVMSSQNQIKLIDDLKNYKDRFEKKPEIDPSRVQKKLTRAWSKANSEIEYYFTHLVLKTLKLTSHSIDPALILLNSNETEDTLHIEQKQVGPYEMAVGCLQGRRPTMEDAHLATEIQVHGQDIQIFGIFDGHGGSSAAEYVSNNIASALQIELASRPSLDDHQVWHALKNTFVDLNAQWKNKFGHDASGSTATVALILGDHLWVANTGDSRTILSVNGFPIQLSDDAKPSKPYYKKGIEKRGQCVYNERVGGILGVARAFGDDGINGVTARPKIVKYDLNKLHRDNNVLILACDGLWDVASTRSVAEYGAHKTASQLAKDLPLYAYNAGSTDNISVMAVQLKKG